MIGFKCIYVWKQFKTVRFWVVFVELLLAFPLIVEFLVINISFNLEQVNSIHPECRFHLEIQEEETKCAELLRSPTEQYKGKAESLVSKNSSDILTREYASLSCGSGSSPASLKKRKKKKKGHFPLFINEL